MMVYEASYRIIPTLPNTIEFRIHAPLVDIRDFPFTGFVFSNRECIDGIK